MKKYLSVFSVIARESILRISFLWIVSAVFQTIIFYTEMNFSDNVRESNLISEAFFSYSDKISVPLIFELTLLITGILLMKTGMEFRTRTGYTLRRLAITEKQVYLLQTAYNCLMIFIMFISEVSLCFALVNWGKTLIEPQLVTNQTVYLCFYSSGFLQNLFAGRNILIIVRNLLVIISLSFNLAAVPFMWRRGSKYIPGILLLAAFSFLFWWAPEYGTNAENAGILLLATGMLIAAVSTVFSRRKEYDT